MNPFNLAEALGVISPPITGGSAFRKQTDSSFDSILKGRDKPELLVQKLSGNLKNILSIFSDLLQQIQI